MPPGPAPHFDGPAGGSSQPTTIIPRVPVSMARVRSFTAIEGDHARGRRLPLRKVVVAGCARAWNAITWTPRRIMARAAVYFRKHDLIVHSRHRTTTGALIAGAP